MQVNNNLLAAANQNDESYFGYRNPDNFTAVSDAYPSVTARAPDLILPTAMWVEMEGASGTSPGESKSDLCQLMDFSKRFQIEEVWPEGLIAKKPDMSPRSIAAMICATCRRSSVARMTAVVSGRVRRRQWPS